MAPEGTEQRKLAAIMFTDMVGYSALAQRNEKLALEVLEEHRRLLRELFPQFDGREVETTGDGFLVEFASALEAAKCAIEIQRAVSTRNLTVSPDRQIQLRIGIHVGDVMHRDGHVLGDGVNIAARLQPLAEPGGICISVDVARQVQNNLQATVVKMGQAELKNIRLPMEICRIVLPWEKHAQVPVEPSTPHRSIAKAFLVALALAVVALGGMGIWFYYFSGRLPKVETLPQTNAVPPVARAVESKSVAVLPFVNMSADKANEYLSDGLTEDLCTALTQVRGLRVPARTSCFVFKGKTDDIQKIGQQLHVANVLEGSVSQSGNKLRITAQLISVADGFHLWATNYDRELSDLLALRSEITQQVVAALRVQLLPGERQQLERKGTENPEAHRLYLLGRHEWNKFTEKGFAKSIEYYAEAIRKDSHYALAYSGLADSYAIIGGDYRAPKEVLPQVKQNAQQAVALDETLPESHVSLGICLLFYEWKWDTARVELSRAVELNPNYADARHYSAHYFEIMGKTNEALAQWQQAWELDPLSPIINSEWGQSCYFSGQYDQAIQHGRKALEFDPNFLWAYLYIAQSLEQQHDYRQALDVLNQASTKPEGDSAFIVAELACVQAALGRIDEAQKQLELLLERRTHRYVNYYDVAVISWALGDTNQTLHWLEMAYDEQSIYVPWLKVDPKFKTLRTDRRFTALLKRIGLEN